RGNAADVEAGSAEAAALDENRVEAELARTDRGDIAAGASADDENLAAKLVHSLLDEQRGRGLDQGAQALDEGRAVMAVDDAMIERRRQVHGLARDEAAVAPGGLDHDLVDADDRHFRPVDDRRRGDSAERAQRSQRDRRTGKLLARRDPLARRLAHPAHFAGALVETERLGVADDRNHEAV